MLSSTRSSTVMPKQPRTSGVGSSVGSGDGFTGAGDGAPPPTMRISGDSTSKPWPYSMTRMR
jgi:hypothetical protein